MNKLLILLAFLTISTASVAEILIFNPSEGGPKPCIVMQGVVTCI